MAIVREQRHTGGDADVDSLCVDCIASSDGTQLSPNSPDRRFWTSDVGQDPGKLVSAYPCHDVCRAKIRLKVGCQLAQDFVARRMAEYVVYGFEAVEVEYHDGDGAAIASEAQHRLIQTVEEKRPIGKVGEWIVQSPVLQIAFQPSPFRRITDRGDGMQIVRPPDRTEGDVHDELGAVLPSQTEIAISRPHGPWSRLGGVSEAMTTVDRP